MAYTVNEAEQDTGMRRSPPRPALERPSQDRAPVTPAGCGWVRRPPSQEQSPPSVLLFMTVSFLWSTLVCSYAKGEAGGKMGKI